MFLLQSGDSLDIATHLLGLLLDMGDAYLGRHFRQTGHIDVEGLLIGDVDGAEVQCDYGPVVFQEVFIAGLEPLGE